MEWSPIETAPKDGTEFLAWAYMHEDGGPHDADGRSFMGEMPQLLILKWREPYGWVDVRGGGSYDGPTHWMPLPDPPGMKPCIHCGHRGYVEHIFKKHLAGLRMAKCASCGALHSEARLSPAQGIVSRTGGDALAAPVSEAN